MISRSWNRLRNVGFAFVRGLAALFVLSLLVVAQPAASEPQTAAAVFAPGTYASSKFMNCPAATGGRCVLQFAPVPARKQVLLTRASCNIQAPAGTGLDYMSVTAEKPPLADAVHGNFIVPTLIGTDTNSFIYQVNQEIQVPVRATWTPEIVVIWLGTTTSATGIQCFLFGTMSPG